MLIEEAGECGGDDGDGDETTALPHVPPRHAVAKHGKQTATIVHKHHTWENKKTATLFPVQSEFIVCCTFRALTCSSS